MLTQPEDNAVIKAVDPVTRWGRTPVEDVEEALVMGWLQALDLDPNVALTYQIEHFGQ
jgi:hypothetical protein